MRATFRKYSAAAFLAFALLAADHVSGNQVLGDWVVTDAHAVLGRPATPGSVAGVARRTTRRVVRRSTIYVAALPAACISTTVNGVVLWRCGATYYQPYGGRYVVVYVD